jgi:hypothetical protein
MFPWSSSTLTLATARLSSIIVKAVWNNNIGELRLKEHRDYVSVLLVCFVQSRSE